MNAFSASTSEWTMDNNPLNRTQVQFSTLCQELSDLRKEILQLKTFYTQNCINFERELTHLQFENSQLKDLMQNKKNSFRK